MIVATIMMGMGILQCFDECICILDILNMQ